MVPLSLSLCVCLLRSAPYHHRCGCNRFGGEGVRARAQASEAGTRTTHVVISKRDIFLGIDILFYVLLALCAILAHRHVHAPKARVCPFRRSPQQQQEEEILFVCWRRRMTFEPPTPTPPPSRSLSFGLLSAGGNICGRA